MPIASFPTYRQLDSMDCGSTCLRIVSKYYGKFYSAATMRERCVTTCEGVSLLGISDAAESIGFRTISVKLTFRQLCDEAPLPCIVHWNQRHFVVVYKIRKGKVYVSDPAAGLLVYDADKFCKSWLSSENGENTPCGIALLLEPTPAFYDEQDEHNAPRVGWSFILRYLKPHTCYIVQLLLGIYQLLEQEPMGDGRRADSECHSARQHGSGRAYECAFRQLRRGRDRASGVCAAQQLPLSAIWYAAGRGAQYLCHPRCADRHIYRGSGIP